MRPVGWGIAGCGWVARDHALPGLLAAGQRVVALHDVTPSAMARMPVEAARCTDLDAFLATPGLEAVYVASPNSAHRPLVEAAAAAGKAVLCEKPLAADVADAEAIVRACAGTVLLGTAYDQRWHPAHRALRGVLPRLGTVTAVRVVYCCWLPGSWSPDGAPHDNWRVDAARAGGGAAIDLAPHGLDLVGVLLGEDVVELTALLQRRVHDYAVDDGALLAGRTASGVLVDLHVAYNTPDVLPRRRLEVVGTHGMAVAVDTMGQTAGGSLTLLDAGTGDGGAAVPVGAAGPVGAAVPFGDASPFAEQFAAFSTAVRGGGTWTHSPERDLRLHRLLVEALTAAGPATGSGDPVRSRTMRRTA